MMQASLCAVAVMAPAGPRRDFIRRKNKPNQLSVWLTPWAAKRRAVAARLMTLRVDRLRIRPPLILWFGHIPSQELKAFWLRQRLMSKPISETTVNAVSTRKPEVSHRSIPQMRVSSGTKFMIGSFRLRLCLVFFLAMESALMGAAIDVVGGNLASGLSAVGNFLITCWTCSSHWSICLW